jgi:hypothetical protein
MALCVIAFQQRHVSTTVQTIPPLARRLCGAWQAELSRLVSLPYARLLQSRAGGAVQSLALHLLTPPCLEVEQRRLQFKVCSQSQLCGDSAPRAQCVCVCRAVPCCAVLLLTATLVTAASHAVCSRVAMGLPNPLCRCVPCSQELLAQAGLPPYVAPDAILRQLTSLTRDAQRAAAAVSER